MEKTANREEMIRNLKQDMKAMASGDKSTLPLVRAALDSIPRMVDSYGDLAGQAEESLIRLVSGKNLLTAEALTRKVAALKAELAGLSPTPLERLLVARIAACWLQVHHADEMCTINMGKVSLEMGDFLQRRQDAAHRRYLTAVKALAQVRRLLVPMIQVNVARQQVVANGSVPVTSMPP